VKKQVNVMERQLFEVTNEMKQQVKGSEERLYEDTFEVRRQVKDVNERMTKMIGDVKLQMKDVHDRQNSKTDEVKGRFIMTVVRSCILVITINSDSFFSITLKTTSIFLSAVPLKMYCCMAVFFSRNVVTDD